MKTGERRPVQKRCATAQHEANEILEHRLIERSAVKFQNHAVEPVNVDQRHAYETGLIVRMKGYR